MNALRIVLIVAALAIFGCAGVERKVVKSKYIKRECVEKEFKNFTLRVEELESLHDKGKWDCRPYETPVEREAGAIEYRRCQFEKISDAVFTMRLINKIGWHDYEMGRCLR